MFDLRSRPGLAVQTAARCLLKAAVPYVMEASRKNDDDKLLGMDGILKARETIKVADIVCR